MPSVFNDTVLNKIVFSNYLTGYGTVWIYEGKVFTVPLTSGYINKNTIGEVLSGKAGQIQIREKLSFDPLSPLFGNDNAPAGLYFRNKYSVIARHLQNFGTQVPVLKYHADTTIIYAINLSIEQLFYEAFKPAIFPLLTPDSAIVWKINSKLHDRFFSRPLYSSKQELEQELARQKWLQGNTYGYNLRFPERIKKEEAMYFMQQDLNTFFGAYLGLHASVEEGPQHTYAVLRTKNDREEAERLLSSKTKVGSVKVPETSGSRHYAHYSQHFLSRINQLLKLHVPGLTLFQLLDKTGINPELRVDYQLNEKTITSLEDLTLVLESYGLELVIEKKRVAVLVVSQKTKP